MTQTATSGHDPRNETSALYPFRCGRKLKSRCARIKRHVPTLAADGGNRPPPAPAVNRAPVGTWNDQSEGMRVIRALLVGMASLLFAQENDGHSRDLALGVGDQRHLGRPNHVVSESGSPPRGTQPSSSLEALFAEVIGLLGSAGASGPTPLHGEHNLLPETLSAREMRILRYLPTHLSASEIAGELYISLNTAKTHLRHIYTKLGVNSRKEAVERARLLRLLAP